MNFPTYSIEREVIKEFESFKVSNLAFALWFHKNFDISFSQMAAKRTFDPYNQLSF